MNMVEDDDFIWDEDIPNDVSYYPVLVIEDPTIVQLGLMSIINEWYQPLIQEQLAETESNPIVIMSIDTLFFYKDIFMRKGFVNVFDDFFRFNKKCGKTGVDWILDELADFNGYMRSTYKPCKSSLNYNKQMVADTTTKYKQQIAKIIKDIQK